jgi:hypothetical protein
MSAKAETHIRALRRLIQEVSNYQLQDVLSFVDEERVRRQAIAAQQVADEVAAIGNTT